MNNEIQKFDFKGASLMALDVDGSHELASIGKDQARTFIQRIGGAR